MSTKSMEYFNKQPRLGCMSTSGKDGKVNVTCFGSPRMVDEKTVVWKGVRVYLMKECENTGERLEKLRVQIAKVAGEAAAKTVHAAVPFEIGEVRPIIDLAQGWGKAI